MLKRTIARICGFILLFVFALTPLSTSVVSAAPGVGNDSTHALQQNVDWLSVDQAARLALDFPVMVPTWIPAPFGGTPSIRAGGGYYSLYWMNSGGPPTFLQITGEVGGSLPAGSPADLNNELSINSSVQGYDAIHDVTSIYDNVWWIAGGVLYTVSSNNMTGTDSMSLANSLVALEQPSAPEPEPTPTSPPAPTLPPTSPPTSNPDTDETETDPDVNDEVVDTDTDESETDADTGDTGSESGPTGTIDNATAVESGATTSVWAYPSREGTMRTTDGVFTASGETFITGLTGGEVSWQAPSVSSETVVEFTLVDAMTGEITAGSTITVVPVSSGAEASSGSNQSDVSETADADSSAPETPSDDGDTSSDEPTADSGESSDPPVVQTPVSGGTNGASASDGTAGAEIPRGADGTGGIRQVVVP